MRLARRRGWLPFAVGVLVLVAVAFLLERSRRLGLTEVAFVGAWESAQPAIEKAAGTVEVPVAFFTPESFTQAPSEARARFRVVFVLNATAPEAPALAEALIQASELAKQQGRTLRIVALARRATQEPLRKRGMIEDSEPVRRYWAYGGATNYERLLSFSAAEYLGQHRTVLPPIVVPEDGLYHPDAKDVFATAEQYQAWASARHATPAEASRVVLVVHQSYIILGETQVIDAMVRAFERAGIFISVVFANNDAVGRTLITASRPELILSLRHTVLGRGKGSQGGPGTLLPEELDVPLLKPISMIGTSVSGWREDPRGLSAQDVGLQLTIQEVDGAIEEWVVGGLLRKEAGYRVSVPELERLERFVRRAQAWLALRHTRDAERRVAIVHYSKYVGRSDVARGSASGAYLNGPRSLLRLLRAMKERGYSVGELPKDEDALLERLVAGARNVAPWAQADLDAMVRDTAPVLISAETYRGWFRSKLTPAQQAAVEAQFGPPPGKLMVTEKDGQPFLVIPRLAFGNVVLAPQPVRGDELDEKLLHDRTLVPSHEYLAFYFWLQESFHAQAVVHFGTHGTLELLPTKAVGLGPEDWGDLLLGDMVNVNPWILDNLGEASLAKRRAAAVLVDHLTPPIEAAGLPSDVKRLADDVQKFAGLEEGLLREQYRRSLSERARALELDKDVAPSARERLFNDAELQALGEHLHHLATEQVPHGLHTLGEPPPPADAVAFVTSIVASRLLPELEPLEPSAGLAPAARREALRARAQALLARVLVDRLPLETALGRKPTPGLEREVERARQAWSALAKTPDEVENLLRALEGRFVPPGPGNDPVRNPAALPTGRNLFTLNPEEIPTPEAWAVGQQLVDTLLRQSLESNGRPPRKVAIDLNGMETMRHFGVTEAMALALVGCRPVWDENKVVVDVALIPSAELGRPRVDVFLALGGTYRDNFPTRMALLDKAMRLASAANDGSTPNFVHEGTESARRELEQKGVPTQEAARLAPARLFGQAPGEFGTRILHLVPRSGAWEDVEDVERVYRENMSYVFTEGAWGERHEGLYEAEMRGSETVLGTWASNMMSPLSNHHVYEYMGGLSLSVEAVTGKQPAGFFADVRGADAPRVWGVEEALRSEFNARLLNDQWIRGLMADGYAGAGQMAELTRNAFGWATTRQGSVSDATWSRIAEVYLGDSLKLGVPAFFERNNPHALQEIAATLLEASRKGFWHATEPQLIAIARTYDDSVRHHGPSNGLIDGGNRALAQYVQSLLTPHPGSEGGLPLRPAPRPER